MKNKTFVTRIAAAAFAAMLSLSVVGFSPVEIYAEQNETTYTESTNLRDLEKMTSTDAYQISLSNSTRLGRDLTITDGFAILDLNGHRINCNGHSIILSGGTLIITDSSNSEHSQIIQTANGNAPVVVNGGELIISGGTFVSEVGDNFKLVFGNVTVNGGTFSTAYGHNMVVQDANLIINDGNFTVSNGYNNNVQTGSYFERSYTGQATVNGGTFISDFANIHPFCSTITINDGTFTSDYAVLMRSTTSSLVLNGGTYIATDDTCMCDDDFELCLLDMLGSGKSLYRLDDQQETLVADDYRLDYTDSNGDTYPLGPSYIGGLPKGTYVIKNSPVIEDNTDSDEASSNDDPSADNQEEEENTDSSADDTSDGNDAKDDNNTPAGTDTPNDNDTPSGNDTPGGNDASTGNDTPAGNDNIEHIIAPIGATAVANEVSQASEITPVDADEIAGIEKTNTAKSAFRQFISTYKYEIILISLILLAVVIYIVTPDSKKIRQAIRK